MTIETQDDYDELLRTTGTSFVFLPLLTHNPDGTWTARYPGADWDVTAPDEAGARQQLHDAQRQRLGDPAKGDWQLNAVREHFAHGPIPGVYHLDAETAARVHNPPSEEELNKAIAHIDRQRAQQPEPF
ncbi:hypothetical protein [Mycobacterium sp.]|uniref:hypothetical protein n=1 Tax=Mycobacterium sp. TaxID=1785 RepID=UPI0025D58F2D|nr:hypothetical protein [Mycobacterium sp.]